MRSRSSFISWPGPHHSVRSRASPMSEDCMRVSWWLAVVGVLALAIPLTRSGWTVQAQPRIQSETVVGDLAIPWAAAFAPDGRLFVTERPGRIRVIRDGRLDPQPWATIQVAHVGEGKADCWGWPWPRTWPAAGSSTSITPMRLAAGCGTASCGWWTG